MTQIVEMRSGTAMVCVLLGLMFAGVIDYITGVEIRAYPLYFLPLCIAAWHFGKIPTTLIVFITTAIWIGSKLLSELHYSAPYIFPINAFTQLTTFGFVAALIFYARSLLDREKLAASTDRTTGLTNSRGFYPLVTLAVATCRRGARPLTLAYIDIDNFKCVNDHFGHQRGDALLIEVAHILKSSLRASDVVARLGGDEFAVCLPETSSSQAAPLLERIRAKLATVMPDSECKVSASIGAVCWKVPPDNVETMLIAADQVMYQVKGQGKNRVELVLA